MHEPNQQSVNNVIWKCIGASVRGSSHEKTGLPCQDAHKWVTIDEHRWLIAAVADGAGSAELSEVGAKVAAQCSVQTVTRYLKEHPLPRNEDEWRMVMMMVLEITLGVVLWKAEELKKPKRQLACTLILVVLGPSTNVAMQIGDGASVIQDEDGAIRVLTKPEQGEYVNETTFLTSPRAIETAQFVFLDKVSPSIAVFSDGLQLLSMKYPKWEPFEPFFNPLFEFLKDEIDTQIARIKLESFLMSQPIRSRTDDDVTLLLAVRQNVFDGVKSKSKVEETKIESAPHCGKSTKEFAKSSHMTKQTDSSNRILKEVLFKIIKLGGKE